MSERTSDEARAEAERRVREQRESVMVVEQARFVDGFVQGAEWQAGHDHRIAAVRALHQPLDAINIDAPPGRQRTRVCAVCAGSSGPWAVWPCATIQAIEGDQT